MANSNLGKAMAPDLGIEGDDGMWGQADERRKEASKLGKARSNPDTRNVRLAGFSPELASHHGSHGQSRVCDIDA
ncbi:hypothetical protein LA080_009891 [Diaporthe eres]|nr:hypothetical protein LA080_009891 [Diaporthe eres]